MSTRATDLFRIRLSEPHRRQRLYKAVEAHPVEKAHSRNVKAVGQRHPRRRQPMKLVIIVVAVA